MGWFSKSHPPKIDDDAMAAEGKGKTLPDPETFPEGFLNRNPLARSYTLAADSDQNLVQEDDEQFYKNLSPYAMAIRKEVKFP